MKKESLSKLFWIILGIELGLSLGAIGLGKYVDSKLEKEKSYEKVNHYPIRFYQQKVYN